MRHKIAIYLRVSTDEQAVRHEGSLDSQKHRLNAFIDVKNIQQSDWGKVVDTYIDDGISAKDTNRPAFQRMMKDLRKGRINLILVTDLSRLSRNIMDFCVLLEELRKYKAQFLSIKEQFDTTTAAGEMMVFNMINLAQFERKQTSERVTLNFHARALRGLRNGGVIPMGFDRHPEDPSKLIVNEDESTDVKAIFNIYLEEGTLARAVIRLNQSPIKPKLVQRSDCLHNRGGRWTIQSLQSILRNYAYVGHREVNKQNKHEDPAHLKPFERYQIVRAAWPALVEKTVFDEVQESLDQNLKMARARLENAKSRVFLVSGYMFCGECGRPMTGTTGHGRSDEYRYYVHRPSRDEGVACTIKTVRADEIEQAILNQLDHVLFREGYLDGIEKRIDEITKPQKEAQQEELSRRRGQLSQVQRQIQAAFRLHAEMGAEIVDDLFKDELVRLKAEKASIESSIKDLEQHLSDEVPTGAEGRKTLAINLAEYKKAKGGANQLLLKRLMRKVVESIVLEPNRIALNYWTSNETRDECLSQKNKRPLDFQSRASVISVQTTQIPEPSPASPENRDGVDFGLLILKNGRGDWTRTSNLMLPKHARYQLRYTPT
jgi:site-specific DNA recombinase